MSATCQDHCHEPVNLSARYRRILWIALVVNAGMFGVELLASSTAESAALLADAIDFFADAGNYAITLLVLGKAAVWRSRAALIKAATMLTLGLFVLLRAAWAAYSGVVPEAATMGAVGLLALAANLGVAAWLYAYRQGDTNMRSVWLCTRNDALGNVAVMVAALGVLGTGTVWPDLAVAMFMASLALTGAWTIFRHALKEIKAREHEHVH